MELQLPLTKILTTGQNADLQYVVFNMTEDNTLLKIDVIQKDVMKKTSKQENG